MSLAWVLLSMIQYSTERRPSLLLTSAPQVCAHENRRMLLVGLRNVFPGQRRFYDMRVGIDESHGRLLPFLKTALMLSDPDDPT